MPVTPAPGAAAAAGAAGAVAGSSLPPVPPTGPPPPGAVEPVGDPVPWYKRPGPLAAAILGALLLIALVAWLIWGGSSGDKDDSSPTDNQLILETKDESGKAIERSFIGTLEGPVGAEAEAYLWLKPKNAPPGPIGGSTGSNGELEFSWKPSEAVSEPTTWTSKITLAEEVPEGWTPPGPIVDCVLERDGEQNSTVAMSVEVDIPDSSVVQTATYSFQNFTFVAGDKVTCSLVSTTPPPTTTTSTTTTSTTTTTTSTTIPETTTIPVTDPTTPPTDPTTPPTDPATTTTVIGTTLWEAMQADTRISKFVAASQQVGLDTEFNDPTKTMTVFAPDDSVFDIPDGSTDDQIRAILEALIVDDQKLAVADIASWPNPVVARTSASYTVVVSPPSLGGAEFISPVDQEGANGYLQVLNAMPAVS